MALSLCSLVIVTVSINYVLAYECPSDKKHIKDCNLCVRCAGTWCNTMDTAYKTQCMGLNGAPDDYCPYNKEIFKPYYFNTKTGNEIQPETIDSYIKVGEERLIKFDYVQKVETHPKVKITVTGSGLTKHVYHDLEQNQCAKTRKCSAAIRLRVDSYFCPTNSTNDETFTLRVNVEGLKEVLVAEYSVPCSCNCYLDQIDASSKRCSGNGDYLGCGECICHKGWYGDSCDRNTKEDCGTRGDIPESACESNGMTCSNNGECQCGECQCYTEDYFGDYCEDICQYLSNTCEVFDLYHQAEEHQYCLPYNLHFVQNVSSLQEDGWTTCKVSENNCTLTYKAKADEDKKKITIVIVDKDKCEDQAAIVVAQPVALVVPVVLGVLAVVAAAAAVAGYMLWKGRTSPLPTTKPKYENIGPKDSTGINPLYKPPTSSFVNPQYKNC